MWTKCILNTFEWFSVFTSSKNNQAKSNNIKKRIEKEISSLSFFIWLLHSPRHKPINQITPTTAVVEMRFKAAGNGTHWQNSTLKHNMFHIYLYIILIFNIYIYIYLTDIPQQESWPQRDYSHTALSSRRRWGMPLLTRRQSTAVKTREKSSENGEYYPIITQMYTTAATLT